MAKKKRREEIVDFVLAYVHAEKQISLKINRERLLAETCLKFGCGEILIKEILKHLLITKKINPNDIEYKDDFDKTYDKSFIEDSILSETKEDSNNNDN